MKLSILICHLKERHEKLERLMKVLRPQLTPDVEVLIESDDFSTIGAKRNLLLSKARGMYVSFIDDDDMVPGYYVEKILCAIGQEAVSMSPNVNPEYARQMHEEVTFTKTTTPDCVGFKGKYICRSRPPATFIHSLKYDDWQTVDGVHQRCPNHLNPIKRDLATQTGFPNKSLGEDIAFSRSIRGLLKTEIMIDEIMYIYFEGKF